MTDKQKTNLDNAAGAGTSDKLEGNAKKAGGRVKEAAGALTGDEKLRREGRADQMEGDVQHGVGKVKEGAEHLLDKAKKALKKH